MPEPTTRPADTDAAGIIAHLRGMTAALAGYAQARAQLGCIESKEAAGHYLKILAVFFAAATFATFGYLFLCLGFVFAVARLFENPNAWIWIALAVAFAHFLAAGATALVAREWLAVPMFSATLDEFKKDQEWLTKKTN